MRLGLAQIAGLPQAKGADPLRKGSFYSRTNLVALFKLWRGLELSSGLDRGMLL